jgi:hypothetical protein
MANRDSGRRFVLAGCGGNSTSSNASSALSTAVSNGPQLGYLWDAADATLRPVLGVPGSSQLGQPLTTAGVYVAAAASARSSIALLQAANGTISSMTVPQGAAQAITGATVSGVAQIAFSPSGLNAVVYKPGTASLLLLSGLSGNPQVQTLPVPSSLVAATVSDTAQVAIASGRGPLSIALVTTNTTSLAAMAAFGGFTFLPHGNDLVLADSATAVVTVIRNASTSPAPQSFTSNLIKTPLAVAGSADGLWVVVANGADPSTVRLDLTGATAPLRIPCACQPSQLTAFNGNAVFSLTPIGTTTSWLVDASTPQPRSVFIPALVKP